MVIMAHYVCIDENNLVTEVIELFDDTELIEANDPETRYGEFRGQKCVRTSYNEKIRKNYASIGYLYDPIKDAFIPSKPFESWVLDENSCNDGKISGSSCGSSKCRTAACLMVNTTTPF